MVRTNKYKRAGDHVDGLFVRDEIPNISSVESSLNHYKILDGIRIVPFSAFKEMGPLRFYSASEQRRTENLAQEIAASRELTPLIVVEDSKGPYVLEGGHRFDALRMLGVRRFPALVVLDLDSFER